MEVWLGTQCFTITTLYLFFTPDISVSTSNMPLLMHSGSVFLIFLVWCVLIPLFLICSVEYRERCRSTYGHVAIPGGELKENLTVRYTYSLVWAVSAMFIRLTIT